MAETKAAESSSAQEADVFEGQEVGFEEFDRFRKTGEVPERLKPAEPAESAPADAPKEESEGEQPESAGASETPKEEDQEPPRKRPQTALQRIALLESTIEKEWEKDEPNLIHIGQLNATIERIRGRIERKAEPAPAPSPAQPPASQNGKPTVNDVNPDGTPKYKDYEEFVEALADWKARDQVEKYKRDQIEQEAVKSLKTKLDEARSRYEDADEIIFPAAQEINQAQIPQVIKEVFAQSEYFPDLCYVVGSDPEELRRFVSLSQSDPRAALARVFEYERGIREELSKAKEPEAVKAPEKRQTPAPKPPAAVTGGSSRAFDVSDESLSSDEWARQRNRDLRKQGKI